MGIEKIEKLVQTLVRSGLSKMDAPAHSCGTNLRFAIPAPALPAPTAWTNHGRFSEAFETVEDDDGTMHDSWQKN